MDDEDRKAQLEEIQSVEAIYADLVHLESPSRLNIKFCYDVQLIIDLPSDYPSRSPPSFELSAPSLPMSQKHAISNALQEVYLRRTGQPVIYEWIDCVNDYLTNRDSGYAEEPALEDDDSPSVSVFLIPEEVVVPPIVSGDIIVDRKSTFQAHTAPITSKDQVMLVMNRLMENNKIARATHNMYAWIVEENVNGRVLKQHDCADDGETGAGAKLLHLLELMKAKNVIVIVTRWYGGIHLGPDRFRHICNVARQALLNSGFSSRS